MPQACPSGDRSPGKALNPRVNGGEIPPSLGYNPIDWRARTLLTALQSVYEKTECESTRTSDRQLPTTRRTRKGAFLQRRQFPLYPGVSLRLIRTMPKNPARQSQDSRPIFNSQLKRAANSFINTYRERSCGG